MKKSSHVRSLLANSVFDLEGRNEKQAKTLTKIIKYCLLYTSDAADDMQCVDLGGRRIIKKKKKKKNFFQAEDGIRDTDRSRGLGDVYKRQTINVVELLFI